MNKQQWYILYLLSCVVVSGTACYFSLSGSSIIASTVLTMVSMFMWIIVLITSRTVFKNEE